MAEKSNAELLQILTAKFRKAEKGGALSNERVAYAKWLKDNTGVKLLKNGKREIVWKSGPNKGKTFNSKEGSKLFNKQYWGTETPRKDLKYLQASELSRLRIKTQRGDSIRTLLSKDDFEGKNIYQQEVTARETKAKARLAKLRIGTSFEKPGDSVSKVSYKDVKVTGAPVRLDNGSFVVLDRDGKNTPILPGTAFYSAAEKAHKEGKVFQLTGGKGEPVSEPVKADNNNLPKTVNDYKGPSSPSSRRHHGTKSLTIRDPETNVKQTYTSPHPQVGRLKINPGGLVGRYDDIRMDNKGSTSLSIAQADWGSYKKGDQLGVMTRSDRRAYDKQVLNVG